MHGLERFSAPSLSTVGMNPQSLAYRRVSECTGTPWAGELKLLLT